MTFREILLPSPGNQPFYARFYYNQASPGTRPYIVHSHPAIEISYFNDCYGTFTVKKDVKYSIEPGDIFVFRSNEAHHVTQIQGDRDIVCMGLHFFPDILWSRSNEQFDAKYAKLFSPRNPNFMNRLPRNHIATQKIREHLDIISQEFENQQEDYALVVKAHLIAIIVLLMRQYPVMELEQIGDAPAIMGENLQRIQHVMDYIDMHITEDMTISQLSGIANMSVSYFSQLFRECNGYSAWDYIISRRIDMAQRLLLSGNEPIYTVALRCGFHNTTNFNKAFKKHTGVAPSAYRKKEML